MGLACVRIGKKGLENMQIKTFGKDSNKSKLQQNKKQTPWPESAKAL
jgi:hypothetical protein